MDKNIQVMKRLKMQRISGFALKKKNVDGIIKILDQSNKCAEKL